MPYQIRKQGDGFHVRSTVSGKSFQFHSKDRTKLDNYLRVREQFWAKRVPVKKHIREGRIVEKHTRTIKGAFGMPRFRGLPSLQEYNRRYERDEERKREKEQKEIQRQNENFDMMVEHEIGNPILQEQRRARQEEKETEERKEQARLTREENRKAKIRELRNAYDIARSRRNDPNYTKAKQDEELNKISQQLSDLGW